MIEVLLVLSGVGVGLVLGCVFRRRGESRTKVAAPKTQSVTPMEAALRPAKGPGAGDLAIVLQRLHELASGMADDVGYHSHTVQQISDSLTSVPDPGPETVLTAVTQLIDSNSKMREQLNAVEDKLQEQAIQLQCTAIEARTDTLTKVANRRGFDEELDLCVRRLQERGETSALMLVDIDHFKRFNDEHGHQVGDEVLRVVARTLRRQLGPRNVVARYGGEEFGLIFPGISLEAAKAHAEKARLAIGEARVAVDGKQVHVTASGGMAELLAGEPAGGLVKRADDALYASKELSRNCAHWHDGTAIFPLQVDPADLRAGRAEPEPRAVANGCLQQAFDGLPTRSMFANRAERHIAGLSQAGIPLSMLLMRIDRWEKILEEYGDRAATMVLLATKQFLTAAIREMDVLGCYDDKTFGVLLPTADISKAARVAERLRKAVQRCELPVGDGLRFTVSVGVAETIADDSSEKLFERSEVALDVAERSGGNGSFCHRGKRLEYSETEAGD